MRANPHVLPSGRMTEWLLPFWTQHPGTGHAWVAALVLTAALVTLSVGTVLRQSLARRGGRNPPARPAGPVGTTWFASHALDGFPEEAARAVSDAPNGPPIERMYAAWILATAQTPETSAAWLQRNLALPAHAARLIVEAAEEHRQAPAEPRNAASPLRTPGERRSPPGG